MKSINKLVLGFGLCIGFVACSDFEEVNTDPKAVGKEFVKPQYALNNSIGNAQMDPGVSERVVVYNWASAARICGEMSFLSVGRYNDEYTSSYYYPNISTSIKHATLAITSADDLLAGGTVITDHEKEFFPNLKQFARIWRAYLISEFVDNFGPYPIESFSGENPAFNDQKSCYTFMLKELKEAAAGINTSVTAAEAEGKCDPFDNIKYNPVKWQKFANSLRMRLAMRLSKVEPVTAQKEFEDAVRGNKLILAQDEMFAVKENNGWDNFTGIYTRNYNDLVLSSTVSNLLTNLGGISVKNQRPDLESRVQAVDYLGIKYDRHYVGNTDNPTKQYWMDGLPANLDPRALKIFCLPDDDKAENYIDKYSAKTAKDYALLTVDADGKPILSGKEQGKIKIDATCCWNGYPAGSRTTWSPRTSHNQLLANGEPSATMPCLGKDYCSGKSRIFFASWETYFLLAEAALYGWNVGTTAEAAYENGVKASFAYFGVSDYANAYLQSEEYNRVGTSVKFSHTAEPQPVTMKYKDGYADAGSADKTVTYQYPTASKTLYGKALNDQLTKIITQKFIAQTPYLALENWSDFRRLGLPFFEIPANESTMVGSDMVNVWTPTSWQSGQKWDFYPQRMRYPTSLDNADPAGYKKAVELLGGRDVIITPLWWAKH